MERKEEEKQDRKAEGRGLLTRGRHGPGLGRVGRSTAAAEGVHEDERQPDAEGQKHVDKANHLTRSDDDALLQINKQPNNPTEDRRGSAYRFLFSAFSNLPSTAWLIKARSPSRRRALCASSCPLPRQSPRRRSVKVTLRFSRVIGCVINETRIPPSHHRAVSPLSRSCFCRSCLPACLLATHCSARSAGCQHDDVLQGLQRQDHPLPRRTCRSGRVETKRFPSYRTAVSFISSSNRHTYSSTTIILRYPPSDRCF